MAVASVQMGNVGRWARLNRGLDRIVEGVLNGTGRYWVAQLIANVSVTLAFLVFAWYFREIDKSIATMVVGASLAHWFRESASSGRAIGEAVKAPKHES